MTVDMAARTAVLEAANQIRAAATAKKCWPCGCLHSSLDAIERGLQSEVTPTVLAEVVAAARAKITVVKYDCLGCEVCHPAIAMNALEMEAAPCPGEAVEARDGWPPFPGNYTVMSFTAPVAVCTLTDDDLMRRLVATRSPHLSIIGTMQTENLGIERLIENVITNPHLRFLILCGQDSQAVIGHLPGRSLLALIQHGVDDRGRISNAPGRRPVLKNVSKNAIDHFRNVIVVCDLIGLTDTDAILEKARALEERNPGPAEPFPGRPALAPRPGRLPDRMTLDPAGYFVVHPDKRSGNIYLEHYVTSGLLDDVISGRSAAEIYCAAIESNLITRLDHAAYLGRELARAEFALESGEPYVQDRAPEESAPSSVGCGCSSSCGDQNK